jgi:hypothetical protein
MRDNLPRLKIELRRAEATIKEEKLRANGPNTSDSTSKALSAQSNQSGRKQSKNKDKKPKLPRDPNAYYSFHEYKGHDIKDYISYKQAQKFFDFKGKDALSTKQEASSSGSKETIYPKAYTTRKTTFSALLSSQSLDDFANI